jgi:hypothetical protein
MSEDSNVKAASPSETRPEPARPAPPPFDPDYDLIGHMEKGQRPPLPPDRPSEPRS